jgi:hypothetical protein
MGGGTDKVAKAAIVCVMVKNRSSNGRRSRAGPSFVNFPVDHPNETEKNRIAKFGYSGHPNNRIFGYSGLPNNRIFGYSVLRVTRITEFGSSGHPNNRIRFFGSPELTRMHPNLAIIAQNRLGASPKNGISLEGIIIFLEKISAKTPNPELLRSIPVGTTV